MCGIAGVSLLGGSAFATSNRLGVLQSLAHRGPDDFGWLCHTLDDKLHRGRDLHFPYPWRTLLLHRRLSILDLTESGWQPMLSPDNRYAIIFNGEIYNYLELRQELTTKGFHFRTQSDTEVLLQAYICWGVDCLRRFIGMFAFAILDLSRQTLFLARDFFGIKPLYWCQLSEGGFAFASEVKSLLELPSLSREVNASQLYHYLCLGLTDHGEQTLLRHVHQLPAAHYMEVPLTQLFSAKPVRYWSLDVRQRLDISFEEATRRLRDLFLSSVQLHLRSDVPVGAALSGGIDSSAIVCAMRYLAPKLDLHTFSYVADDPCVSEERWVDVVASHTRATVHKITINHDQLKDDLPRLLKAQDFPFGSTSIYAQYRVFRRASEVGIKVMLDGQGADELLAGYRTCLPYRLATLVARGQFDRLLRMLRYLERLPGSPDWRILLGSTVRHLLLAQPIASLLQFPKICSYVHRTLPSWMCKLVSRLLRPRDTLAWLNHYWFATQGTQHYQGSLPNTGGDRLRAFLYQQLFESSLPMLLRYEDRNSMAWSIESRVPFLTPQLAQFLLCLPEEYLLSMEGTSKHVFREAMRGIVPDCILDRRDKIGFVTPEQTWLTGLRPWITAILGDSRQRDIPALRWPEVQAQWENLLAGQEIFSWRFWRWINLVTWVECYGVKFADLLEPDLPEVRQLAA